MREGGVKIPGKLPTLFMDGPLPAVQIWQDEWGAQAMPLTQAL